MNLVFKRFWNPLFSGSLSKKDKGFTLFEVLISMAILVLISFSIYEATTETYKLREILSMEGSFYSRIRLCTDIIERDISLLYSPTIFFPFKALDPQTQQIQIQEIERKDDLARSYTYWSKALHKNGIRPSRFIGTDTQISFISLSHTRIYQDTPESAFAKITYALKKDQRKGQDERLIGTSVLIKTESPNAFAIDDIKDIYKRSFELLTGIRKFTFLYYQRDSDTWKTSRSWDSDKEETKNIYPDVIEMKIELIGHKQENFEGIYKFKPEIPLDGVQASF